MLAAFPRGENAATKPCGIRPVGSFRSIANPAETIVSTVGKALALLDVVAELGHEAGLSEIARLCGLDKATARRFLVDLQAHGFIEQDAETRRYRIGAAPVRLARIREARFPLVRVAIPVLKVLAEETAETVHLSEFAGGHLSTIHVEDSPRAHRVIVQIGAPLPLHATASGLAFLAYCPQTEIEAALAAPLERYTDHTITDRQRLRVVLEETAARGFSIGDQGLEAGVISTAAPIRAPGQRPIGALAIAAPMQRADMARMQMLGAAVARTSAAIASLYNGAKMPTGTQATEGGKVDERPSGITEHTGHRNG